MKRLLAAIACAFVIAPTHAADDSAGELRDSCKALVAISKGAVPKNANEGRLCLWVFATAQQTYQHMRLTASEKGRSPLAACKDMDVVDAIEAWLGGPAQVLERSDKIAIATTSIAQFYTGQCRRLM